MTNHEILLAIIDRARRDMIAHERMSHGHHARAAVGHLIEACDWAQSRLNRARRALHESHNPPQSAARALAMLDDLLGVNDRGAL